MTGLTYKGSGVDPTRAEDALGQVRARIAKTKRPEVIGDVGDRKSTRLNSSHG